MRIIKGLEARKWLVGVALAATVCAVWLMPSTVEGVGGSGCFDCWWCETVCEEERIDRMAQAEDAYEECIETCEGDYPSACWNGCEWVYQYLVNLAESSYWSCVASNCASCWSSCLPFGGGGERDNEFLDLDFADCDPLTDPVCY